MTPDAQPPSALTALGWQDFFARQTDADEMARTPPVRVALVHRNGLLAVGDGIETRLPPGVNATVGDWLMFNRDQPGASRVLERKSLIKRRAPGSDVQMQLIAANLDTAFIVTSCNQDFNIARLERYVALVFEADADAVIVLTKTDLCDDPQPYVDAARTISASVPVVTLNAKSDAPREKLAQWCAPGRTVGFIGSSGVGKSTLVNALSDDLHIETQAIREDDARGRHTTTRRQLHFITGGCAVLDTPGMRELQLTDAASGVADVFAELQALTHECKFRDCKHVSEPGCAVLAAVKDGRVDPARFERWRKLVSEDRDNSAAFAASKSGNKALSKLIRQAVKAKRKTRKT